MRKLKLAAGATSLALFLILAGRFPFGSLNLAPSFLGAITPRAAYAAPAAGNITRGNAPAKMGAIPQMKIDTEMSAKFLKVLDSIPGGPVQPCSELSDPYPEFNGVAIDSKAGVAVLSDPNLKGALVYDLNVKASPKDQEPTPYKGWVKGPATFLSFATGIGLDTARHEFYIAENDYGDDIARFPYHADGDYTAKVLAVPHGVYGIAVSQKYQQMAVTVEHNAQIVFYKLEAEKVDLPLRSIRGIKTRMADPHGLAWDEKHGEIFVANYGNWSQGEWDQDYNGGGRYFPPSITVYRDDAKGDIAPIRVIQGTRSQFNWPTGITVDPDHNEIFVTNEINNDILVFRRDANGNAAPLRVLGGPRTQIWHPMGVAIDPVRNEIWVANFNHTAEVFARDAQGDIAPKRLIRNAPAGSPHAGFGNPTAIAYDSRRDEILVPN